MPLAQLPKAMTTTKPVKAMRLINSAYSMRVARRRSRRRRLRNGSTLAPNPLRPRSRPPHGYPKEPEQR